MITHKYLEFFISVSAMIIFEKNWNFEYLSGFPFDFIIKCVNFEFAKYRARRALTCSNGPVLTF